MKAPVTDPISDEKFEPLKTAKLDTPVFDVVNMFSAQSISAVPIIDDEGIVVNLYETVAVIVSLFILFFSLLLTSLQSLVKSGSYYNLDMTVSVALNMRSPDFPGVVICSDRDSLGTVLTLIRTRRIHRLVVVESEVSLSHTPPKS